MAAGEAKRIALWSFWILNVLVSAVYVVMSFATCNKLVQHSSGISVKLATSNSIWRAPIAASALGGIMVMLFQMLSCVILIRKTVNQTGPSFGYGFIAAWCFVMSFFTLLCGLVMEGFKDVVSDQLEKESDWDAMDTGAFKGTFAFAYLCCIIYMVFFLSLLFFQGGITKQLGIYEEMNAHKRVLEMNTLAAGANPLASTADKNQI